MNKREEKDLILSLHLEAYKAFEDSQEFVYSCCQDSVDGIFLDKIIQAFDEKRLTPGTYISCYACGKFYHVYILGLKWTSIVLPEEIQKEVREARVNNIVNPPRTQITFEDVLKLTCKICGQSPFKEHTSLKEAIVEKCQELYDRVRNLSVHSIEEYIEVMNESNYAICPNCLKIKQQKVNNSLYN